MRSIGVRELKAHLSRTLRDVQRGDVYLVTDRGRVVAELRPPASGDPAQLSAADQAVLRMAGSGELRVAERPRVTYTPSLATVPDGSAKAWLDWSRGGE